MNTAKPASMIQATRSDGQEPVRLHYLDWLRAILILAVFTFHALQPFMPIEWHIDNDRQSTAILVVSLQFIPWGLPLFFLISGAGSKFALRRRNNRQYIGERVARLLIPFVVGSILLMPIQRYLEALNKGSFDGSFLSFLPDMLAQNTSQTSFSPVFFGLWGLHLWFLGFLFSFSLMALPLFRWFKRESGQSLISWLANLVDRRGGSFLFIIPLALVRVLLQPINVGDHGWVDFTFSFIFFVLGYIIFSDEKFLIAIRRDRWLLFAVGIGAALAQGAMMAVTGGEAMEWFSIFIMPWTIVLHILYAAFAWCAAIFVLSLASTGLNNSNKLLVYGNENIMPFYLLHQPVIIGIAYFVVQWGAGILAKLSIVLFSSLLVSFGLVELIRHIKPIRSLLGMKSKKPMRVEVS